MSRFGAWGAVVATITVGAAAGLIFSQRTGAGIDASQLQRSRQPVPLRGAPLGRKTGLHLVVADIPSFVLDVDMGGVTPVPSIPALHRGVQSVVGVAGQAAVVIAQSAPHTRIYAVRGRGKRVSLLGIGRHVWPASDGLSVWVQSSVDRSHCALRQIGLDGRELRAARAFPCASGSDPSGGSLGLVVQRTRLIDPITGRTVLKARLGILAVAGEHVVLAGPGTKFTLLDGATHAQRQLPWPSILAGLDQPAVDPQGRFVALAFADPAWNGGQQVLDVWLLDTETGTLIQLPGMPAFVSLKYTSMAWTADGRLVLLGESAGNDVVAVWRPGMQRLAVKTVQLPERIGVSDTFAPVQ